MRALEDIVGLVGQRYGLKVDLSRPEGIQRRLSERLVATGTKTLEAYRDLLARTTTGEWDELLDLLTVHETYFFRDEAQMSAIREEILPALAKLKARERRLRVWSAGCSTGEEAYSLSILIRETGLFEGWDVAVIGTDVSARCVRAAKEGIYRPSSFRMPNPAPHAFAESGDRIKVLEPYAKVCEFWRHNLIESMPLVPPASYDLVLCRNVLLYVRDEVRPKLIELLVHHLRPEGWLLLGHAEAIPQSTAPGGKNELTPTFLKGALVYRRASNSLPPRTGMIP